MQVNGELATILGFVVVVVVASSRTRESRGLSALLVVIALYVSFRAGHREGRISALQLECLLPVPNDDISAPREAPAPERASPEEARKSQCEANCVREEDSCVRDADGFMARGRCAQTRSWCHGRC